MKLRVSATQHEVYARVVWAAIDLAQLGGLPRAHLFEGLPFDAKSARRLKRVAWSDYCTLVENIGRLAGDGLEDLLEASYHQVFPEMRAAFGMLVDCKPLLRFMMTIANPIAFQPVEHHFEDLGDRHVRVSSRLRPGARPCETWFRGTIGALRGIPRYCDQPPAHVIAQITPDSGIYEIFLPPSRTLLSRMRRTVAPAVRIILGREPDGTPVSFGPAGEDPFEEQIDAAVTRWKLTPRQVEVLRRLAHGESEPEMAQALDWATTTIALVVAQLLQKTGATSRSDLITRLWNTE